MAVAWRRWRGGGGRRAGGGDDCGCWWWGKEEGCLTHAALGACKAGAAVAIRARIRVRQVRGIALLTAALVDQDHQDDSSPACTGRAAVQAWHTAKQGLAFGFRVPASESRRSRDSRSASESLLPSHGEAGTLGFAVTRTRLRRPCRSLCAGEARHCLRRQPPKTDPLAMGKYKASSPPPLFTPPGEIPRSLPTDDGYGSTPAARHRTGLRKYGSTARHARSHAAAADAWGRLAQVLNASEAARACGAMNVEALRRMRPSQRMKEPLGPARRRLRSLRVIRGRWALSESTRPRPQAIVRVPLPGPVLPASAVVAGAAGSSNLRHTDWKVGTAECARNGIRPGLERAMPGRVVVGLPSPQSGEAQSIKRGCLLRDRERHFRSLTEESILRSLPFPHPGPFLSKLSSRTRGGVRRLSSLTRLRAVT
jgi:hypothetical protein